MAKVFETRDDVAREVLEQKARTSRDAQNTLLHGSAVAGLAATVIAPLPVENKFLKYAKLGASVIGVAVSALALGLSFRSRYKAIDAEQKLESMGPVEIVLPKDIQMTDEVPNGKYVTRLQNELASKEKAPEPNAPKLSALTR